MSLAPGSRLGPYEILGPIGAGGMGEIYRARDPRLGREVAVKVLPADVAGRPDRLARFEREARSVASLNHPNIVTLHSIEESEGTRFLTMELVEGESLDLLVATGGLPIARVLELAIPLADALSAAHERGVVHRDLKPANVMVTREGRVKVLDFGLAKLESPSSADAGDTMAADPNRTVEGNILGTAAYMSPEQAEGKSTDARCDVFSLGVILYELTTGNAPFQGGSTMATIASVLTHRPRPVSEIRLDLPPAWAGVVAKCLEKDPRDRYSTALELRHDLERLKAELSSGLNYATTPSPATVDALPAIHDAFARREWETAYRALHELKDSRPLSPEELEMLGTSALWLSKFDECLETREDCFNAYHKAGRNVPAARMALQLVSNNFHKNAISVAQGWRKRAERLLENEADCVEHGYLHRHAALAALGEGDFTRALDFNRQMREVADRFRDPDLQAMGLHLQGRILVASGDAQAGTALVDEAMAGAVTGTVKPFTLGILFCNTMAICESLGDFNRAREWNDAAGRWCGADATSPWPSVCRVHSTRTMRQQGRWAEAEVSARKACEALRSCGLEDDVGEAYYEIGELEFLKGDYTAAEASFQQAHEHGCDPVPGLPLLRLAQGKPEAAARMLERALNESSNNQLRRANLLSAQVVIDLAASRLPSAASAVDELMTIAETFGSAMYKAHALMGRGGVALAHGDVAAATPTLREAWSIFRDSGFPYDAARARVLLGEAYERSGNAEDARMQFEAARKVFVELGAKPDAEALSARLAGAMSSAATARTAPAAAAPAAPSIAVLPFANMSPDPADEFFSDGITDEIINALAQLPGLKVAARTSCFAFKGKHEDLRMVGEKLGAATLLEGSVRKAGSRLRITAQLINAADGYHLWSERYDREFADVFAIQDEIASAIAEKLRIALGGSAASAAPAAGAPAPRREPRNLDAYELFLKGRVLQTRRGSSLLDSAACFQRAVELDPELTEAHAWLADSYRLLGIYGIRPPSELVPRARAAAERALALDPNQVEGLATLAGIAASFDRDIAAATKLWDRALALDPTHVRALGERSLNIALYGAGGSAQDISKAVRDSQRAVEVDSLNAWAVGMHAMVLGMTGDRHAALRAARAAVELDAGNFLARWALVECLLMAGEYPEVLTAAEPALAMSGRHPYILVAVAAAHAVQGNADAANAVFQELEGRSRIGYIGYSFLAVTAASAGRLDEARRFTARAIEAREGVLYFYKGFAGWAALRADRECAAAMRAAGL